MIGRLRDESGFTLIEMLVGISVGMVVLFGAFQLVENVLPEQQRIGDRVDASQRGRLAMENMSRQLGASICLQTGQDAYGNPTFDSPYLAADGNSVTFYSDLVTNAEVQAGSFLPEKRTLSYANGKITEQIWQGSGTVPSIAWPTNPTSTRVLAANVAPIGSTPIFSYWAYDGTATLQPVNPPQSTDLPRIEQIDIAFRALPEHAGSTGAGTDIQDSVSTRVGTDFSSGANAQKGPQCAM